MRLESLGGGEQEGILPTVDRWVEVLAWQISPSWCHWGYGHREFPYAPFPFPLLKWAEALDRGRGG